MGGETSSLANNMLQWLTHATSRRSWLSICWRLFNTLPVVRSGWNFVHGLISDGSASCWIHLISVHSFDAKTQLNVGSCQGCATDLSGLWRESLVDNFGFKRGLIYSFLQKHVFFHKKFHSTELKEPIFRLLLNQTVQFLFSVDKSLGSLVSLHPHITSHHLSNWIVMSDFGWNARQPLPTLSMSTK